MLPACLLQLDQGVPVELVTRFDAATGTSADEATLRLDEARLNVEDARLLPCAPAPEVRLLGPSLARADHAAGDPLAAPMPHVIALGAADSLGVMRPPAGRYCTLRVTVIPSAELGERTLVARGQWERLGSSGSLELLAFGQRELDLPLEPALAVETGEGSPQAARVELRVDLPSVLRAQAVVGRSPDDLGLDVLIGLAGALEARVLP